MIAAIYLVSLSDTGAPSAAAGGGEGSGVGRGSIVLHRRWCPSANAAGSVAVVDKFFKEARARTAEAIAAVASTSAAIADGGGDDRPTTGRDGADDNDKTGPSPWSLNVLPPVVETDIAYVVFRRLSDGLLLMASCQVETSPLMLSEFLKVFHDTLASYVGAERLATMTVSSFSSNVANANQSGSPSTGKKLSLSNVSNVVSSITNNTSSGSEELVVLAAQLLDEMVDGGFPVQTELSILKSLIAPPSLMNKMAAAVTGQNFSVSDELPELQNDNIPWRRTNVRYASNEIYFDIEEQIDAIFDPSGMLVTCDVHGVISVNSKLSGFPDLMAQLTVREGRTRTSA